MSEIIKKGRDSFVAACGHCGCEFRYRLDEVRRYTLHSGGKIKCPQCSTELHHRDQGGGR